VAQEVRNKVSGLKSSSILGNTMPPVLGEQSVETKYFFELTPDRILRGVERFGVRCTGRVIQLNSMENRVYEVEVEVDGELQSPSDKFRIIKFYRPGRWSKEQILEEHEFLIDLQKADIPAVAPLTDVAGQTLLTDNEINIYFAVFPKRGGRSPDELIGEQAQQIGRLLARVHMVGASKETVARIELTPQVYARDNLKYLLASGAIPADAVSSYSNAVEHVCQTIEPLFSGIKAQRIHGDCHFGNVLWGSEGAFLVDFDDMVRGPAVQDFWLLVGGRDEYAVRTMDHVIEGYEQLRTFNRNELKLIEPLRALRLIHFSAWIARRWNDPAFQRVFPQFGTGNYWNEQTADLRDQLAAIQEGGFGGHLAW